MKKKKQALSTCFNIYFHYLCEKMHIFPYFWNGWKLCRKSYHSVKYRKNIDGKEYIMILSFKHRGLAIDDICCRIFSFDKNKISLIQKNIYMTGTPDPVDNGSRIGYLLELSRHIIRSLISFSYPLEQGRQLRFFLQKCIKYNAIPVCLSSGKIRLDAPSFPTKFLQWKNNKWEYVDERAGNIDNVSCYNILNILLCEEWRKGKPIDYRGDMNLSYGYGKFKDGFPAFE